MRVICSMYVKTQIRGENTYVRTYYFLPHVPAHAAYRLTTGDIYVWWYHIASLLYLLREINYILQTSRDRRIYRAKRNARCVVLLSFSWPWWWCLDGTHHAATSNKCLAFFSKSSSALLQQTERDATLFLSQGLLSQLKKKCVARTSGLFLSHSIRQAAMNENATTMHCTHRSLSQDIMQ